MRKSKIAPSKKHNKVTQQAVWRAVASSTAVETGQSVAELEAKLQNPSKRFAHITLAR